MALSFRTFRHKVTGQVFRIPAGRYGNFQNAIKKIVNFVYYNYRKYYIVHLTLTVAENISDVDYKHLHRVDALIKQRLKRAGAECKHIAVKELQDRGAVSLYLQQALCIPFRSGDREILGAGVCKNISSQNSHAAPEDC